MCVGCQYAVRVALEESEFECGKERRVRFDVAAHRQTMQLGVELEDDEIGEERRAGSEQARERNLPQSVDKLADVGLQKKAVDVDVRVSSVCCGGGCLPSFLRCIFRRHLEGL